jgi:hypothetical protein
LEHQHQIFPSYFGYFTILYLVSSSVASRGLDFFEADFRSPGQDCGSARMREIWSSDGRWCLRL